MGSLATEHALPTAAAGNLDRCLAFLERLVRGRIAEETGGAQVELPTPSLVDDGSPFAAFAQAHPMTFDEYTVLALALAPHLRPGLLDTAVREALPGDADLPQVGGVRDAESRDLMPTGETAAFLLAGDDLEARFAVQRLFGEEHWFARQGILRLAAPRDGAPVLSGRLQLTRDWVEGLTLGTVSAPAFGAGFPARRITTSLDWEDLVLAPATREQIEELHRWVRHAPTMWSSWGMEGRLRPGYRALFHGPSGTGKTLTATLLGKTTGRDVYRVDLSTVVSKYIGETEKNLASLFDVAQNKDWILFFDEADSIFGKRTTVKDAHDRYANQEVSYLLQRVEEFAGLAILASNFRANMDDAFLRRFNAIVRFAAPTREERAEIWRRAWPRERDAGDLPERLAAFELTGGNIVNVVQYAIVESIEAGAETIRLADAVRGVRREMEKEGRVFRDLVGVEG